jgi:hypothetical protein
MNPEIIEALINGIKAGKSTREMCVSMGINQRALWNRLAMDSDLMNEYLNAKECAVHARIEEIKRA